MFAVESSYNGNKYNLDRPKVDYTIHYKSKDFIPDSYYEFNLQCQNLVIFLFDVPVHQLFWRWKTMVMVRWLVACKLFNQIRAGLSIVALSRPHKTPSIHKYLICFHAVKTLLKLKRWDIRVISQSPIKISSGLRLRHLVESNKHSMLPIIWGWAICLRSWHRSYSFGHATKTIKLQYG